MAKEEKDDVKLAKVDEAPPVKYPSGNAPRLLNVAAAGLSAAAIVAQALVAITQQTSKSKTEKAGIETAVRLTILATLARAVPSVLSEVRTISRELQRGKK